MERCWFSHTNWANHRQNGFPSMNWHWHQIRVGVALPCRRLVEIDRLLPGHCMRRWNINCHWHYICTRISTEAIRLRCDRHEISIRQWRHPIRSILFVIHFVRWMVWPIFVTALLYRARRHVLSVRCAIGG